jgi:hypothetical protein
MKLTNLALAIAALFAILGAPSNAQQNSGPSGGSTYSPDTWIDASKVGVDCTGTNDSTSAIQSVFTTNPNAHLMFPTACKVTISSTIAITNGVGPEITSESFAGQGGGPTPTFTWAGANGGSNCTTTFADCVYMFDFETTNHPVVQNISFVSGGGGECPDGFLKFDGSGGTQTPTNAIVRGNFFGNASCGNANFVAINVSPTALANHEDYVFEDNNVQCSGTESSVIGHNGSISSSTDTTLTDTTDAPFTSAMVGTRIRVSYGGYASNGSHNTATFLDTTIASYTSASQVTLSAAWPFPTQTGLTLIQGTSNGIGFHLGESQNDIQEVVNRFQYYHCAYGLKIDGGSVAITAPSDGYSDYGIWFGSGIAQPASVDLYASEQDNTAIYVANGITTPITITRMRGVNNVQNASGYVMTGSSTLITGSVFQYDPPAGGVMIGRVLDGSGALTSVSNSYYGSTGAFNTYAGIGFSEFINPPPTSINDGLNAYATILAPETLLSMQPYGSDTSAPGANFVRFQVVCGTTAHTAKIQVIGGTSTTPQTLLDNIGAGVSGC